VEGGYTLNFSHFLHVSEHTYIKGKHFARAVNQAACCVNQLLNYITTLPFKIRFKYNTSYH